MHMHRWRDRCYVLEQLDSNLSRFGRNSGMVATLEHFNRKACCKRYMYMLKHLRVKKVLHILRNTKLLIPPTKAQSL